VADDGRRLYLLLLNCLLVDPSRCTHAHTRRGPIKQSFVASRCQSNRYPQRAPLSQPSFDALDADRSLLTELCQGMKILKAHLWMRCPFAAHPRPSSVARQPFSLCGASTFGRHYCPFRFRGTKLVTDLPQVTGIYVHESSQNFKTLEWTSVKSPRSSR
jgi:hypothetical protein